MDIMGANVPDTLFAIYEKALSSIGALVAAAGLNPGISALAAFSVAGVGAAGVIVHLVGLGAAAYVGVVIGCALGAAVVTAMCSATRVTPQSASAFLRENGIYASWIEA